MPFTISAEFLLGTYQGRDSGGKPERYPSPDRLYKALVSVAYRTFQYEHQQSDNPRGLSDEDISAALDWLEGNPPDSIYLPHSDFSAYGQSSSSVVYRNKGYIDGLSKKAQPKVAAALASTSVTYPDKSSEHLLAWQWEQRPSPSIESTLSQLCWEVPYLGEACSKVRLSAQSIQSEEYPISGSVIKDMAVGFESLMRRGHIIFAYPGKGRLEELKQGYEQINPAKASSKVGSREAEQNLLDALPMLDTALQASYSMPAVQTSEFRVPWPDFIVIPVELDPAENREEQWRPRPNEYVGWSVALHRFLVRQWGLNPPPSLLGKYVVNEEELRPANNVAIQILSESLGAAADLISDEVKGCGFPAFIVMLPDTMPEADKQVLFRVCRESQGKHLFFSRNVGRIRLGSAAYFAQAGLWKQPPVDRVRFWRPFPMAVSEIRPMPDDARTGRRWKAAESMYLALGHVWRDNFSDPSDQEKPATYEQRIWHMVHAVSSDRSPMHIYDAHPIFDVNMQDYAHHVNKQNVLRGTSGLISIDGEQHSLQCAAISIGQSRHLGGGLLLPVDLPQELVERSGERGRKVPVWLQK